MKQKIFLPILCLLLTGCQHQLNFPSQAVLPTAPVQDTIVSVVVTNPEQTDYDSMVYRYSSVNCREVHYSRQKDSITRTYYYDNAGRLSALADERAIYFANNDIATRMNFEYSADGKLTKTVTDFTHTQGVEAYISYGSTGANQQLVLYDTNYFNHGLDWANRIIYSTITASQYLVYDSGIYKNSFDTSLLKTTVNVYNYESDSAVNTITRKIYFNAVLSETGILAALQDAPAIAYRSLQKNLYRNLANWFQQGLAWQDDNYHLFPLTKGPYKSIAYHGSPTGGAQPYFRNFAYTNTYKNNRLTGAIIDYSLTGQGTGNYTYVLRFYYNR